MLMLTFRPSIGHTVDTHDALRRSYAMRSWLMMHSLLLEGLCLYSGRLLELPAWSRHDLTAGDTQKLRSLASARASTLGPSLPKWTGRAEDNTLPVHRGENRRPSHGRHLSLLVSRYNIALMPRCSLEASRHHILSMHNYVPRLAFFVSL